MMCATINCPVGGNEDCQWLEESRHNFDRAVSARAGAGGERMTIKTLEEAKQPWVCVSPEIQQIVDAHNDCLMVLLSEISRLKSQFEAGLSKPKR